MKLEEKDLLLKDLCARLAYGVKIRTIETWSNDSNKIETLKDIFIPEDNIPRCGEGGIPIEYIKPYLFPMSSMTEEQKKEFIQYAEYDVEETVCGRHYEYYLSDYVGTPENPICNYNAIDWCNKNHFDYRGFIPMGLALDATGLDIY